VITMLTDDNALTAIAGGEAQRRDDPRHYRHACRGEAGVCGGAGAGPTRPRGGRRAGHYPGGPGRCAGASAAASRSHGGAPVRRRQRTGRRGGHKDRP
jgi:hypothetical protein